jgi:hypothetical protein
MSRFAPTLPAVFVAFVVFGVALAACGDSSTPDPGPSSGVDADTRIIDLSDANAVALCDWVAGKFGGYGRGVTCTDGTTLSARQTRELCLMDYRNASPSCTATVGDIEQCTNEGVGPPRCATVPAACFVVIPCILGAAAATER